MRRVPKKGRALRGQGPGRGGRAKNTTYFIISYVSKNVYSSHAKSMLPFSKHRSRDALRAGLVAIRSRQRVSERRSPEQGENGSAGCWPQKIHPHTQLLRAQAKTRSIRNILGASKAELISPKALGKTPLVAAIGRGSQLLASPNSRKMGQDFGLNCYGQADICPDSLSGRHNGFVQSPDHFSEISRIFR